MSITKVELLNENGTWVRDLTGWLAESILWSEEINEFGAGQIAFDYDHADVPFVTKRRLIRVTLDGAAGGTFTWQLQRPRFKRIATEGQVGRIIQWTGKGALSVLGTGDWGGVVTVGAGDTAEKIYGWIENDWDDSAYPEPTHRGFARDLLPEDADFPDDTAQWIGSAVGGAASYLRRFLDVPSRPHKVGPVRIFTSGKGDWTLWIDEQQYASGDADTVGSFDFEIEPDGHQVALKVDSGPGLFTVARLNDDGSLGSEIYRSFTTGIYGSGDPQRWRGLEGGQVPAGVTWGYVMSRTLQRGKDDGAIPGVTWTFTDALDTNGNAWQTSLPLYTVRANELAGDLALLAAQAFACDVRMLPDLQLGGYDPLGATVATVNLIDEADQTDPDLIAVSSASVDGHAVRGTVVRLQTRGGFSWVIDSTAVAQYGRIEVPISIGTASSVDEVETAAEHVLAELLEVDYQDIDSHGPTAQRPYGMVDLGDVVGCRLTWGGGMVNHRLNRIGVMSLPAAEVDFDLRVEHRP